MLFVHGSKALKRNCHFPFYRILMAFPNHQAELIASDSAEYIVASEQLLNHSNKAADILVSLIMAKMIIDKHKTIQIHIA